MHLYVVVEKCHVICNINTCSEKAGYEKHDSVFLNVAWLRYLKCQGSKQRLPRCLQYTHDTVTCVSSENTAKIPDLKSDTLL